MKDESIMFSAVKAGDAQKVRALVGQNRKLARAKDKYGCTVLFEAVMKRHEEVVNLLIAAGADVNARCCEETLLHKVLRTAHGIRDRGITELVLFHGGDPNAKDVLGSTALHIALTGSGYTRNGIWFPVDPRGIGVLVELLLANKADAKSQDNEGCTPLHCLIRSGLPDVGNIVELLVAYGADVNTRDNSGATRLHYAAAEGRSDILETLLETRAYLEARDSGYRTPLHYAAANGRMECADILLRHNANACAKDITGMTPMHRIAISSRPDSRIGELLLAHKADINARDRGGSTTLHLAAAYCENTQFVEFLLAHGAETGATDQYGRTPSGVAAQNSCRAVQDMIPEP